MNQAWPFTIGALCLVSYSIYVWHRDKALLVRRRGDRYWRRWRIILTALFMGNLGFLMGNIIRALQ